MSKRSIEYQEERLRRIAIRKEKRKAARRTKYYRYGHRSEGTCPNCGGQMTWCSGCQQWSRNCCVEYGTCYCS